MLLIVGLSSLFLIGCSPNLLEIQSTNTNLQIPIVERPVPVKTSPVKFYVVTPENKAEFERKFLQEDDSLVYYAISVESFENLSKNFSEAIRYISQMNEIVQYYEGSIVENELDGDTTEVPR